MIGSQPGLGAIPYNGGVTFRVWASFARAVRVAGEFTGWEAGAVALGHDGDEQLATTQPAAVVVAAVDVRVGADQSALTGGGERGRDKAHGRATLLAVPLRSVPLP